MTGGPYELRLRSRGPEGPDTYRFETADGVASRRSFREAELLLANALWDADRDLGRVLCPAANYGVVGTLLAARADVVRMTESSARAARLCRRNAGSNGAGATVDVSLLADLGPLEGPFDTVAYAPKRDAPLAVGSQHLADALAALRPGGRLYLAGTETGGLSRYVDRLEALATDVERIATGDGYRVVRATRPAAVEAPTYVSPRSIEATVDGVALSLVAVPGLFAASGLDDGTRLLLETAGPDVADGQRVLDLCCGYGPVGAYAAAAADCDVRLTDDCRIATACAERGLRATGVEGTVVTADCLRGVADRTFDTVLCNPPTHAGDGVLATLFAGAADVLAADGRLSLVHHRDLDLRRHLTPFSRVERRHTGEAHVVLTARP